jgi:hypothetical protein
MCKHEFERTSCVIWRDTVGSVIKRQCDCGAWCSLGPSNDAPPTVKIEIRAAEIAASGRNGSGIDTWGEHDGWHAVSRKPPASARRFRGTPGQLAGYLARVIAMHGGRR